jgi:hypothetical protein
VTRPLHFFLSGIKQLRCDFVLQEPLDGPAQVIFKGQVKNENLVGVTALYTVKGGLKAVIWTDTVREVLFQIKQRQDS